MTGGVARIRFFARFIIVLLHDFVGRRLWRYRWEGAMNIVVAYCGPDAQLQGSVLRLRKRSADFSADDFAKWSNPGSRVLDAALAVVTALAATLLAPASAAASFSCGAR
jgi:hypothetical protein